MVAAVLLAISGWAGLFLVVNLSLPTIGPRWLFFTLLTAAVTGTALPFLWLLHRRFDREASPIAGSALLRQAILVGLFASLLTWLQINRSLSLGLAIVVAAGLAAIDFLIRLTERARWWPGR
jgi:hypothetical protein